MKAWRVCKRMTSAECSQAIIDIQRECSILENMIKDKYKISLKDAATISLYWQEFLNKSHFLTYISDMYHGELGEKKDNE